MLSFRTQIEVALRDAPQKGERLFGVLDAARDSMVLSLLCGHNVESQSLYEGVPGEMLDAFAPHLVAFDPRHAGCRALLESWLQRGWGASWGIFVTSAARFSNVRRHLRRLLMVKLDDGRRVYFRFYDPRVLRTFLPLCTARQAALLFADVSSYLTEGHEVNRLLRFEHQKNAISITEVVAQ